MVTVDLARRAQDRVLEDGVGMDDKLTLPAFREEDLEFLDRLDTDPAALGDFGWFGFCDVRARRRRWEQGGRNLGYVRAVAQRRGDRDLDQPRHRQAGQDGEVEPGVSGCSGSGTSLR
jgi:hypothetical protein